MVLQIHHQLVKINLGSDIIDRKSIAILLDPGLAMHDVTDCPVTNHQPTARPLAQVGPQDLRDDSSAGCEGQITRLSARMHHFSFERLERGT